MKNFIIAIALSVGIVPVLTQASTEITRMHHGALTRTGNITTSGGTIDELSQKLSQKASDLGADYFRITSLNTRTLGYATATLYNSTDVKSSLR